MSLDREVASHGLDTNSRWRHDIALVVDSIRNAAAFEGRDVLWKIVGDSGLNASALPGAVLLVNVGLPLYCDSYSRNASGQTETAIQRKYYGCLASVIGHEFGHITLGHSDSLATLISRREQIATHMEASTSVTSAVADQVLMRGLRYERDQELDADRAGALYLLRAGWEVQDAIDLFMSLDSTERRQSSWQHQLSWIAGHPRSSERVARLEAYRAKLKLDQRDFDDALTLIAYDEMPDSALAMLDRVLSDFPRLPAAKHAKAVLLTNRWLSSTSVKELKLRPSFPTYDVQFMSSIKGEASSTLRRAVTAFEEALAAAPHPYTLSSLAVLNAYSGDLDLAARRATEASARMPDDPEVSNNLGVVQYLSGRKGEARETFARAETLSHDDRDPAILFNVARTLAETGNGAASRDAIDRYLAVDSKSSWSRALEGLDPGLGSAHAEKADTRRPLVSNPVIGGIRLRSNQATVVNSLGEPDAKENREGNAIWRYDSRGLTAIFGDDASVLLIMLTGRAAGDIENVHVGDSSAEAMATLGPIAERSRSPDGDTFMFDRGRWAVVALIQDGIVHALAARAIP